MRSVLYKKIYDNTSNNGWDYYLDSISNESQNDSGIFIKMTGENLKFIMPAHIDFKSRENMRFRRALIIITIITSLIFILLLINLIVSNF